MSEDAMKDMLGNPLKLDDVVAWGAGPGGITRIGTITELAPNQRGYAKQYTDFVRVKATHGGRGGLFRADNVVRVLRPGEVAVPLKDYAGLMTENAFLTDPDLVELRADIG